MREFTITYSYTPELRRRYFWRELLRTKKRQILSIPVMLAFAAGASLLPGMLWVSGFAAGLAISVVIVLSTTARRFASLGTGQPVTASIGADGVRFDGDGYQSSAGWPAITSVRVTPDGILLTPRLTGRPVLLPAAVVTPELTEFILGQHAAAHPGR